MTTPKPEIRFTMPGPFSQNQDYRRELQDLAWAAVGDQPAGELRQWPAGSVLIKFTAIGTLRGSPTQTPYQQARLFSNMLKGVIFRDVAVVRELAYKEDGGGDRLEVVVRKVE